MLHLLDWIIGAIAAIALICVMTFGLVGFIEMPVLGHLAVFTMSIFTASYSIALLIWRNRGISE